MGDNLVPIGLSRDFKVICSKVEEFDVARLRLQHDSSPRAFPDWAAPIGRRAVNGL
jgi:hypothetical protein